MKSGIVADLMKYFPYFFPKALGTNEFIIAHFDLSDLESL